MPVTSLLKVLRPPSPLANHVTRRSYATELPRPPPPTSKPVVETFSSTSRPRPYSARHLSQKPLPLPKKGWPLIFAFAGVGVFAWAGFLTYVTNQEKISSSVVKQIMRTVRQDSSLKELLGEVIRPEPQWWLNGDPRIKGNINQLQGNIDVTFRLKGTKGSGTLYFTSIRKDKGLPFMILRFKVIGDDGTIVNIKSDGM